MYNQKHKVIRNSKHVKEMLSFFAGIGASPDDPDALLMHSVKCYGEKRVLNAFEAIKDSLPPDYWIAYKKLYNQIHER